MIGRDMRRFRPPVSAIFVCRFRESLHLLKERIMNSQKRNRNAFRPTLGEITLEERVVLSSVSAVSNHIAAAQVNSGNLTVQQLRNAFVTQTRSAFQNLNQQIRQEIAQLFANGRPTSQQLADFNAQVQGMINATTFQLASQQALLPQGARTSLTGFQNALLSNNSQSLMSRIQAITNSSRLTRTPQALQNAIANQIATMATGANTQLANFFNNTNINRLSVDQNGNPIPLQQFIGQRIQDQFGSTLGGIQQGFNNIATNSLFANGAPPSASDLQGFQRQLGNAASLAAFQLGNNLNLLRGTSSTLVPQIQSALFGSSTNPGNGTFNGLLNAVQGLPFSGGLTPDFNTALTNAFNNTFTGVATPLGNVLGTVAQTNGTLPAFSNVFSPAFTNNNAFLGFNSGFGSGFPGFGTAPNTFNPAFGTGFNSFVNTGITNLGFTTPTFSNPIGGFV